MEHVAAEEPDIFLRGWWRPKTSQKESEYLTNIHQVSRNRAPNYINVALCLLDV